MIFEISDAIFTVAKSILDQRFVTVCGDSTGLISINAHLHCLFPFLKHQELIFRCIQKNWFFDPKNQFSKFLKQFLPCAPDPIYKNPPVRSLQRSNKNFWDFKSKIRFLQVVGNLLEILLTCYNMFLGQNLRPA